MHHLLDATMFWNTAAGGVRRYLETKSESARYAGWRHTIATTVVPPCGGVVVPSVALPGAGGYRMPIKRKAAARIIAACKPHLIESGDPYRLAWASLDAAQMRGVPAVGFCHSNIELLARNLAGGQFAAAAGRAARRYARHLYGQFDAVLAPSKAMCKHLADWGVDRIAWQPLGVDTMAFHPWQRHTDWRRQLGLARDTRLLIYAGRFAPEKNLHVLSAAVRRLGRPYWLVAVGEGPTPPRGDRVTVLPATAAVRDLAAMLSSADAFVHAGDQETFGLSLLEAMACATPVVARATEGLAELVNDDVGVGVHGATGVHFADGIAELFSRDRGVLSRAARTRAVAQDWRRVLPLLWLRYERLLQGQPGYHKAFAGSPTAL